MPAKLTEDRKKAREVFKAAFRILTPAQLKKVVVHLNNGTRISSTYVGRPINAKCVIDGPAIGCCPAVMATTISSPKDNGDYPTSATRVYAALCNAADEIGEDFQASLSRCKEADVKEMLRRRCRDAGVL